MNVPQCSTIKEKVFMKQPTWSSGEWWGIKLIFNPTYESALPVSSMKRRTSGSWFKRHPEQVLISARNIPRCRALGAKGAVGLPLRNMSMVYGASGG